MENMNGAKEHWPARLASPIFFCFFPFSLFLCIFLSLSLLVLFFALTLDKVGWIIVFFPFWSEKRGGNYARECGGWLFFIASFPSPPPVVDLPSID